MRVLHVTTFLQGGAGRVIADLAIQQRRDGHDVLVVSDADGRPGYASYPEYVEALSGAGVETHGVRSTFTRDLALNVDAAGWVRRLLNGRRVDVVHAHAAVPSLIGRLACAVHRAPVVVTMHGWGVAKTADQARTDVTLLGLADAVVTPSAALADHLGRLGVPLERVRVVCYGIGPASRGPVESGDRLVLEAIRARGGRVALCVGTIGARKNQQLLVQALAEPGLESVHALFVGDGDASALEAAALRKGVRERTHILGYRPDASRYLPHADLLVLPSRDEGLPLAVLEALRDGVPVVASDIPQILEALDQGRMGEVFAAGSPTALAGAISRVLAVDGTQKAARAAASTRHWERHYRRESMTAAYGSVYGELLQADPVVVGQSA